MMMMLSKVKRGRRGGDDDALPVAMVLLLPSLRRSLSPLPPWPFLDICPLFSSIFFLDRRSLPLLFGDLSPVACLAFGVVAVLFFFFFFCLIASSLFFFVIPPTSLFIKHRKKVKQKKNDAPTRDSLFAMVGQRSRV